ncbi:hypothetical protein ADUPG1_000881 [Aduncisulcus paluster]|uniref:Kinetochore protein SPC25 n=1 Tax=Aduncisulcus paluster TaxID=2918883 RepID=A0ABQ5K8C4_9EUKA|nr:hypothetical protein ADUPG1_000881 [Aduncisulcus paluster]
MSQHRTMTEFDKLVEQYRHLCDVLDTQEEKELEDKKKLLFDKRKRSSDFIKKTTETILKLTMEKDDIKQKIDKITRTEGENSLDTAKLQLASDLRSLEKDIDRVKHDMGKMEKKYRESKQKKKEAEKDLGHFKHSLDKKEQEHRVHLRQVKDMIQQSYLEEVSKLNHIDDLEMAQSKDSQKESIALDAEIASIKSQRAVIESWIRLFTGAKDIDILVSEDGGSDSQDFNLDYVNRKTKSLRLQGTYHFHLELGKYIITPKEVDPSIPAISSTIIDEEKLFPMVTEIADKFGG